MQTGNRFAGIGSQKPSNQGPSTIQPYASGVAPRPPAPQFFIDTRKGEVNDLQNLLKKVLHEKDQKKKREVIKRVIAFMTLGYDVSKLYAELCLASHTNDRIQKKMIYFYLTNYAELNSELAVMAINTFLKDFKHPDPKIRGLALRNLCSLRFSGAFEFGYFQPSIMDGLRDIDPYVRKTAILGCVKLFYLEPDFINKCNIIDALYTLIKDPDQIATQNAIIALNEIMQEEGGIALSQKLVIYLLNKLKELNEWGQALVLDLVSKYKSKNENEAFDIMNLLVDRLKVCNMPIVLATIKIFINISRDNKSIYDQVLERIYNPILSLISTAYVTNNQELCYIALSHILNLLNTGASKYFEPYYKHFYSRVDDLDYNKVTKIQILANLASNSNFSDIVNELIEYTRDLQQNIGRKAVRALGLIGLKNSMYLPEISRELTYLLLNPKEHIVNEIFIVMRDIFKRNGKESNEFLQLIPNCLDFITDDESKSSLAWIVAEFANKIEDSPYILERFITNMKENENSATKFNFLQAALRIFFLKPGEMKAGLAKIFSCILNNPNEDIDTKERTAFYYQLMCTQIKQLEGIVKQPSKITEFYEDTEAAMENNTYEFNTLALIFQKNPSKFVKLYKILFAQRTKENLNIKGPTQGTSEEEVINVQEIKDAYDKEAATMDYVPEVIKNEDLLSADIEIGSVMLLPTDLVSEFELNAETYQNTWMELPEASVMKTAIPDSFKDMNGETLQHILNVNALSVLAYSEGETENKFYCYSQHTSQMILLSEINLNKIDLELQILVKCSDDALAKKYANYVINVFLNVDANMQNQIKKKKLKMLITKSKNKDINLFLFIVLT